MELTDKPFQNIRGDALDAGIDAVGGGVDGGADVTWGFAQAIGPPATGGVEDHVVFGAGIGGGGVDTAV